MKKKGPRTLEQAVAAYRNALAERTRERVPAQWAMTRTILAPFAEVSERSESPQPFKEATPLTRGLEEWTQERSPMTRHSLHNLAVAQKSLAERLVTRNSGLH